MGWSTDESQQTRNFTSLRLRQSTGWIYSALSLLSAEFLRRTIGHVSGKSCRSGTQYRHIPCIFTAATFRDSCIINGRNRVYPYVYPIRVDISLNLRVCSSRRTIVRGAKRGFDHPSSRTFRYDDVKLPQSMHYFAAFN